MSGWPWEEFDSENIFISLESPGEPARPTPARGARLILIDRAALSEEEVWTSHAREKRCF